MATSRMEPSPRRADARRSRQKLLAAAADLLGRDPSASIDAIAAYADVGRTTAFRHFATRDALILATWAHMLDEADAELSDLRLDQRPAAESLVRLLETLTGLAERWPLLVRGQRPAIDDLALTRSFARTDAVVTACVRRAAEAGGLRRDLPVAVLSETLLAVVQAVLIAGLRGPDASSTATSLLLHGAAAPPDPTAPLPHRLT